MVERLDNMSSVKLGGFRSQLEASFVSSHTEKLRNSPSVDNYIYIIQFVIFLKNKDI